MLPESTSQVQWTRHPSTIKFRITRLHCLCKLHLSNQLLVKAMLVWPLNWLLKNFPRKRFLAFEKRLVKVLRAACAENWLWSGSWFHARNDLWFLVLLKLYETLFKVVVLAFKIWFNLRWGSVNGCTIETLKMKINVRRCFISYIVLPSTFLKCQALSTSL